MRFPSFKKQKHSSGHVGLEIGNGHLAACHFADGILKRCHYRDFDVGEIGMTELLPAFLDELGLKAVPCSVVITPPHYQMVLAEMPPVGDEEIAAALPWKIKDLLRSPLDQLMIDYFKLPEDAYRGRQKMLYAVAANKTDVTAWVATLENQSMVVDRIEILELAAKKFLQVKMQEPANVATLYLNDRRGFMTVCQAQGLYLSRNIEIGMTAINGALPEDEQQFSGGQHLDNVLLEVQRSLDYYESQMVKGAVNDLYVAPLGENHQRIVAFLDRNLAARVHSIDLNEYFESEELLDEKTQYACFSAATAGFAVKPPEAD